MRHLPACVVLVGCDVRVYDGPVRIQRTNSNRANHRVPDGRNSQFVGTLEHAIRAR